MRDLHKSYGAVHAVQGIDFEVARGEVFGLLGPNGAGKTTTVEVLEGYRERTSGIVSVLGHDPGSRPRALRERVGIVLQSSGIYRHATPRELVAHWAGFYPAPRDVEEVIDLAGLRECEDVLTRKLSGGQSRRLDFALALDRRSRAGLPRRADDRLRSGGAARGLGDDPRARRPRQDRPAHDALPRRGAGAVRPRRDRQGRADPRRRRAGPARRRRVLALPRRAGATSSGELVSRETDDPTALLHQLTSAALARGVGLEDLSVSRPSLEDVYLELTAEAVEGAEAPL